MLAVGTLVWVLVTRCKVLAAVSLVWLLAADTGALVWILGAGTHPPARGLAVSRWDWHPSPGTWDRAPRRGPCRWHLPFGKVLAGGTVAGGVVVVGGGKVNADGF